MMETMAKQRNQKNFNLGPALLEEFEAWCRENLYDEKAVFLAGWSALRAMSHEQRAELMKGRAAAENGGSSKTSRDTDAPTRSKKSKKDRQSA